MFLAWCGSASALPLLLIGTPQSQFCLLFISTTTFPVWHWNPLKNRWEKSFDGTLPGQADIPQVFFWCCTFSRTISVTEPFYCDQISRRKNCVELRFDIRIELAIACSFMSYCAWSYTTYERIAANIEQFKRSDAFVCGTCVADFICLTLYLLIMK